MAPKSMPKVIYGAAPIGNVEQWKQPADLEALFQVLDKHNSRNLDTAQLYRASEATLGPVLSSSNITFTVDTKWLGGWVPGSATKQNIIDSAKDSLSKLHLKNVDVFYIHAHDSQTPLADTLAGVNEAYKLGLFSRFGLSNYLAAIVQEVYDICESNNYVLPSVYQVNYSAVTRLPEDELFPLLRKLNIAIYAYSPIAGGFLARTRAQIEAGESRFGDANFTMYAEMYKKPAYLDLLDKWEKIAEEVGCTKAELAYRWVAYHSALEADKGDGVIVGASSLKQLEATFEGLEKGPLPGDAAKKIEGLWEGVRHEAPVDNFHR